MIVTLVARGMNGVCKHTMVDLAELDDGPSAKPLSGSVGANGANKPDDVKTIQSLLNAVSLADGGPQPALAVDGICGALTKAAILKFQKRWTPPLMLMDGRIDPNKNTWKKLMDVTGAGPGPVAAAAKAAGGGGGAAAAPVISEEEQKLFMTYLYLARWRIYNAIRCLDEAQRQMDVLNMRTFMRPPVNFITAYSEKFVNQRSEVEEVWQINRCFKFLNNNHDHFDDHITYAAATSKLQKIRTVFTTMLEVIAKGAVTTDEDERKGTRRFVRVVRQGVLDVAHPQYGRGGVLADAVLGGWSFKDATRGRIRYGSAHTEKGNVYSTLIHELAHFVSSQRTYSIGDHGYYQKAFTVSPYLAIRNAESYAWYALLATFKSLRSLPNNSLPTDI